MSGAATAPADAPAATASAAPKSNAGPLALGCLGLLVIVGSCTAVFGEGGLESESDQLEKREAATAAREARVARIRASSQPDAPPVNRDSLVKERDILLKRFIYKKDEVENGGWYVHRDQTVDNSWNRKTLKVHVSHLGYTYLESQYYGDDWVFHEKIIVRIDDRRMESETIPSFSSNNRRNNSGGSVWEHLDFVGGTDQGIMKAIAANPSAKVLVRFVGDEAISDIELRDRDKKAIADGVRLGELLKIVGTAP